MYPAVTQISNRTFFLKKCKVTLIELYIHTFKKYIHNYIKINLKNKDP